MRSIIIAGVVSILVAAVGAGCGHQALREQDALVPPAPREFRAAWVATVRNIDWPSKPGLTSEQQVAEILAILDKAVELNLNAIVLQVRTSADALYPSPYEPWSEYLTGEQGKAPEPYYDPLKMWVDLAHERGLELHAWFNPYRARHANAETPNAPTHISNTRPELVKQFNGWEWLDPGEKEARDHTLRVFLDVVERYDIDGVHIDDYFYPYPDYLNGEDFPDDAAWERYLEKGGKLSRDDWRRQNVNELVEAIYKGVKRKKKSVRFGISPFGIWQPGHPPVVQGFNQYESLYADARFWLNEGWCDYYTPQLYWKATAPNQPYADLLEWWIGENTKDRHIWPGLIPSRINSSEQSWVPQEIIEQIEITRRTDGATGNVHFSMITFMQNRKGISDELKNGVYAQDALVPASVWLDRRAPARPSVEAEEQEDGLRISWKQRGGEKAWQWGVYTKYGERWVFETAPGDWESVVKKDDPEMGRVEAVAISAVDRLGNESERAVTWRARPLE